MENAAPGEPSRSADGDRQLSTTAAPFTFVLDDAGQVQFASARASELLGEDPGSLQGSPVTDLVAEADQAAVATAIEAVDAEGASSQVTHRRFETPAGDTVTADVHVEPFTPGADGTVLLTAQPVADHDVDPQRDAATERRQLALEGANLGVWDWNMATGEVQRDDLLVEMLGYEPGEMGSHIADWADLVHPAGKECHDAAFAEHVENRTPYYECEYRMQTADGDWKWLRTIGKVVEWDEDDEPRRAVGIHQDVDERKRAQLALREERDLFREGPVVVFQWRDEPGWPIEYVSQNVEQVLGYAPGELETDVGDFAELVHEADLPELEPQFGSPAEAGQDFYKPDPYRVRTADGDCRWIQEFTKQRDTAPGQLFGYLVDITQRKERQRRLEEQRDSLEILNQVLRHDIRNDLSVVSGYAELLADRVDGVERDYVQTLQETALHATELTRTGRDMAEAMLATEAGGQAVDLRASVESQIEEVQSAWPDAIVRMADSVPAVEVAADEMLRSVFRNLLKNGVIHSEAAVPVVSVSATRDAETVQVCVADNGPGIPDAQKDRVFGKGDHGLESPGTGIGLYLVRTLVDRYDGAVWVEDREPTGAIFVVDLPLAEGPRPG